MNSFKITSLTEEQKSTRRRILQISREENISHLGSCFCSVDLIDCIYQVKKKDEKFVLSNGHAGIALYAILEKYGYIKDPEITKSLYIHPDRNPKLGIDVSTGSLGQGLPIALGLAFADRKKNVYCMISDGECAEGSIWEALRIAGDNKINNLKIVVNANGWSAYDPVNLGSLIKKFIAFGFKIKEIDGNNFKEIIKTLNEVVSEKEPTIIFGKTCTDQFSFLQGLDAHYYVLTDKDYKEALKLLK